MEVSNQSHLAIFRVAFTNTSIWPPSAHSLSFVKVVNHHEAFAHSLPGTTARSPFLPLIQRRRSTFSSGSFSPFSFSSFKLFYVFVCVHCVRRKQATYYTLCFGQIRIFWPESNRYRLNIIRDSGVSQVNFTQLNYT